MSGQIEIGPILSFAVPFAVEADKQKRRVGGFPQGHGALDGVEPDDWAHSHAQHRQIQPVLAFDGPPLDGDVVGRAGFKPPCRARFVARGREELFAVGEVPVVDGKLAVDVKARGASRDEAELMIARRLRRLPRADARGEVQQVNPRTVGAHEHE